MSVVRQMIAEDEASIVILDKLIASETAHRTNGYTEETRRKLDDRRQQKLCYERALEGLKLKLDAILDSLDYKALVRVSVVASKKRWPSSSFPGMPGTSGTQSHDGNLPSGRAAFPQQRGGIQSS